MESTPEQMAADSARIAKRRLDDRQKAQHRRAERMATIRRKAQIRRKRERQNRKRGRQ